MAGKEGQSWVDLSSDHPIDQERYRILYDVLAPHRALFEGKQVLDFGCSFGMSACLLADLGATVTGVEPEAWRVEKGQALIESSRYEKTVTLHHVPDTRTLPLGDASVDVVVANAVLEHIPQPRGPYIRELWRVLAPGGLLFVNETPNKYLPWDFHTTGLVLVNWLPSAIARRYSLWRNKFSGAEDWDHSGWRGLGHYELTHAIPGPFSIELEMTRFRHRALAAIGLPSSLLDPYPTFIIRKAS
jgi:2-polyprenyl-3-methyl-5-hydroxy-6-metoxy-1,4-benzoquinol methylase